MRGYTARAARANARPTSRKLHSQWIRLKRTNAPH
jgi:hypothetical protein